MVIGSSLCLIYIFAPKRLYVVFDSAFEADMHEKKFNPFFWRRIDYPREREDLDKSKRGNAYVSCEKQMDTLEAYQEISLELD